MYWLYWNYIKNSWNYIKNNWIYIKNNWEELDYKTKRCVYIILFIYFIIFFFPLFPKLYSFSKKSIINIVSSIKPIQMDPYHLGEHRYIPNRIRH